MAVQGSLELRIDLPNGARESLYLPSTAPGSRLLQSLKPLKALHGLGGGDLETAWNVEWRKDEGMQQWCKGLLPDESLEAQGLRDGTMMRLRRDEQQEPSYRRPRSNDVVVVDEEKDASPSSSSSRSLSLSDNEEAGDANKRSQVNLGKLMEDASRLKELGSKAYKVNDFATARNLYTAAVNGLLQSKLATSWYEAAISDSLDLSNSAPLALTKKDHNNKEHQQQGQPHEDDMCQEEAGEEKEKEKDVLRQMLGTLLLNRALTALKMEAYEAACRDALTSCSLLPDNAKAFYRLALAYEGLAEVTFARNAMEVAVNLAPDDPAIRQSFANLSKVSENLEEDQLQQQQQRLQEQQQTKSKVKGKGKAKQSGGKGCVFGTGGSFCSAEAAAKGKSKSTGKGYRDATDADNKNSNNNDDDDGRCTTNAVHCNNSVQTPSHQCPRGWAQRALRKRAAQLKAGHRHPSCSTYDHFALLTSWKQHQRRSAAAAAAIKEDRWAKENAGEKEQRILKEKEKNNEKEKDAEEANFELHTWRLLRQPHLEVFFAENLMWLARSQSSAAATSVALLGTPCSSSAASWALRTLKGTPQIFPHRCAMLGAWPPVLEEVGEQPKEEDGDGEDGVPRWKAFQATGRLSVEGSYSEDFWRHLPAQDIFEAGSLESGGPPNLILVCDALPEDLLSQGIVETMKTARRMAERKFPVAKIQSLPSAVTLLCTPAELVCEEVVEGISMKNVDHLRVTTRLASKEQGIQRGSTWRCPECTWVSGSSAKTCEGCGSLRKARPHLAGTPREPGGFCSFDFDFDTDEGPGGSRALAHDAAIGKERTAQHIEQVRCGATQALATFNFQDLNSLELESRRTTRTMTFTTTRPCRLNSLLVHWSLLGLEGCCCSCTTTTTSQAQGRCAVYYLGFEVVLDAGEEVTFEVFFEDSCRELRFRLVRPKFEDRLGWWRLEREVSEMSFVDNLEAAFDVRTNRLARDIRVQGLRRGDKLLKFGPFEANPNMMTKEVFQELRKRLRPPEVGKSPQPISCTFARGGEACSPSARYPSPPLAEEEKGEEKQQKKETGHEQHNGNGNGNDGSSISSRSKKKNSCEGDDRRTRIWKLPRFFDAYSPSRLGDAIEALRLVLAKLSQGCERRLRMLEIGSGPLPIFSLLAARSIGARCWVAEQDTTLQEMALMAVRDFNLELLMQPQGLRGFLVKSNQQPHAEQAPGVRVLPACGSPDVEPSRRVLDSQLADLILLGAPLSDGARPGNEALLATMQDATQRLLAPAGACFPHGLRLKAILIGWWPLSVSPAEEVGSAFWARRPLRPLSGTRLCRTLNDLDPKSQETLLWECCFAARCCVLPSEAIALEADQDCDVTGVAIWQDSILDLEVDGSCQSDEQKGTAHHKSCPPNLEVHFLPRPLTLKAKTALQVFLKHDQAGDLRLDFGAR